MLILLIEPYYGGSHRHLIDGLASRLEHEVSLWTLPPRKWKWRMRGAAMTFLERLETSPRPDRILCSTLMSVAEFRGMLPRTWRRIPLVAYFHENQVAYPTRHEKERDYHYPLTNLTSALAADRSLWNSEFNRTSFLDGMEELLAKMPDAHPSEAVTQAKKRSRVLPVPIDWAEIRSICNSRPDRDGPARIVWNHRWEHDKAPRTFFHALFELADREISYEVAVLGEQFREGPAIFEKARKRLGDRIVQWGYVPSRAAYLEELMAADFVVSTSRHEFQGLAVLEAVACGCVPVVPDDLVYPEFYPDACRYPRGSLTDALAERIAHLEDWRSRDLRDLAAPFSWENLLPEYESVLEGVSR